LGLLWQREPATDGTPADLDQLWQRAHAQAIAAGNGDAMARRIADDVVRQVKARDNES
jgi:hypothetical protein